MHGNVLFFTTIYFILIIILYNIYISNTQYSYVKQGQTNYWTGDCIPTEAITLVTYEKYIYKEIACQSDLCNSPTIFQKLSTGILCKDGFYI